MRSLVVVLGVSFLLTMVAGGGVAQTVPVAADVCGPLFRACVVVCQITTAHAFAAAVAPHVDGASASAFAVVGDVIPMWHDNSNPVFAVATAHSVGVGDSIAAAAADSNNIPGSASCYVTNIITLPLPLTPDQEELLWGLGCRWTGGAPAYHVAGEVVVHDASGELFLETPRGWADLRTPVIDHSTRFVEPLEGARPIGVRFTVTGDEATQSCRGVLG